MFTVELFIKATVEVVAPTAAEAEALANANVAFYVNKAIVDNTYQLIKSKAITPAPVTLGGAVPVAVTPKTVLPTAIRARMEKDLTAVLNAQAILESAKLSKRVDKLDVVVDATKDNKRSLEAAAANLRKSADAFSSNVTEMELALAESKSRTSVATKLTDGIYEIICKTPDGRGVSARLAKTYNVSPARISQIRAEYVTKMAVVAPAAPEAELVLI
jgi:hypothetical protein